MDKWKVVYPLPNITKTVEKINVSWPLYDELIPHCKIWGFHGGDYEEWCLLGCYAMWLL
jgi:hypothetical protein